ncbi:hypothetical protein Mapa_009449 [Marchantia paleacea]|nr:hypothetical protein Mapa_009449 [Marchantia paleacea]
MSTAQFVVGVIGNITSICLFLSPVPTFVRIFKLRSTEEYSAVPYVATLLNCFLWLLYGSPFVKWGVLVVTINGAGAFIEFVYLFTYLVYSKDRRTRVGFCVPTEAVVMIICFVPKVVKTKYI